MRRERSTHGFQALNIRNNKAKPGRRQAILAGTARNGADGGSSADVSASLTIPPRPQVAPSDAQWGYPQCRVVCRVPQKATCAGEHLTCALTSVRAVCCCCLGSSAGGSAASAVAAGAPPSDGNQLIALWLRARFMRCSRSSHRKEHQRIATTPSQLTGLPVAAC